MSKRNKVLLGGGGIVLLVVLVMVSVSAKREKGIEVRFEQVGRRRHRQREDSAQEESGHQRRHHRPHYADRGARRRPGPEGPIPAPDRSHDLPGEHAARAGSDRSEERRVGKECRSRWSPY